MYRSGLRQGLISHSYDDWRMNFTIQYYQPGQTKARLCTWSRHAPYLRPWGTHATTSKGVRRRDVKCLEYRTARRFLDFGQPTKHSQTARSMNGV